MRNFAAIVAFAALLLLTTGSASAQIPDDRFASALAAIEPKLIAWRRDIHANTELSNREFRTAELVAGAEFIPVDDMAHDVPQVHWTRLADAISELTHRAS